MTSNQHPRHSGNGSGPSLYWHDYEAFGADARRDRACQFAGIRTDMDLNEVGEPLIIYCQPALDYLPHPQACLITGITPQLAQREGLPEAEFIRQIHAQFSQPQTCGVGYNSIRYDDEMTRQLLYRNLYDPYEREWKNGNSRWDLMDVMRLCHALRPTGLQWPQRSDGGVSFRLEDLSRANGIDHANAHDALADVRATIGLARCVRQSQPKLYDFAFELRRKHSVSAQLDLASHRPVLHVSGMYPAAQGCLTIAMPLAAHPTDTNGVLLYDLMIDPGPWLECDVSALRQAMFTPSSERADGELRLPVTTVHLNRSPMLAPMATLEQQRMQELGIDMSIARQHWEKIHSQPDFMRRIASAMVSEQAPSVQIDPDFMIYSGGFFSDADKRLLQKVRQLDVQTLKQQFSAISAQFRDGRLPEMLFRYRARNFPSTLDATEQQRWQEFCRQRLQLAEPDDTDTLAGLSVQQCRQEISSLRQELGGEPEKLQILDALEQWIESVCLKLAK